jgi:hypothetical protein
MSSNAGVFASTISPGPLFKIPTAREIRRKRLGEEREGW